MDVFEHFPEDKKCPVCGTNEDKASVLVPIDGTEDRGNVEAIVIHKHCIDEVMEQLVYNHSVGILYTICQPE